MKNLIPFTLLTILSLALLSQAAFAGTQGRAELNAISEAKIQADLARSLKELFSNSEASSSKVTDYIFCAKDADIACKRYVLVDATGKMGEDASKTYPFVLEYAAEIENGKVVISSSWDWQVDAISMDRGNAPVVLLAIPQLEKDYEGGAPIKSKDAFHPFQVKVVYVSGNSESYGSGDEKGWEGRSNYIVHFIESGSSSVVAFSFSNTYLVRTKEKDDTILKSDVRRLLKLDELLK